MGLKRYLFFLVLFALGSWGCKKDPISPKHYDVNGTVFLINSNTPVPNALVRFFKNDESDNIWAPEVLEEVGSTFTDSNGRFTVPKGTGAQFVRAYGQISVFKYEAESGDAYLDGYSQGQGDIALYLKPPAWVKVRAIDVEPLNPEISSVKADTFPGSAGLTSISSGFKVWQEFGNVEVDIEYLYVYEGMVHSPPFYLPVGPLTPFDTTVIEIPY